MMVIDDKKYDLKWKLEGTTLRKIGIIIIIGRS